MLPVVLVAPAALFSLLLAGFGVFVLLEARQGDRKDEGVVASMEPGLRRRLDSIQTSIWGRKKQLLKVREQLRRIERSNAQIAKLVEGSRALTASEQEFLRRSRSRLHNGFSETAIDALTHVARSEGHRSVYRLAAMTILLDWYELQRQSQPVVRHHDLDIVLVSNMNLPGGTTSSNIQEVHAYRKAGLRVGLLHHPVYKWNLEKPINNKVEKLLEDDGVVMLGANDAVDCDLMIIRLPTILMKRMDDLPRINARRTVLLLNQTPFAYYGPDGGIKEAWEVRTVHANLTEWVGEHTWYPTGPVVREALGRYHSHETVGINISASDWFGVLDVDDWERGGRRNPDGRIRIGRQSRDHLLKWPEDPGELLACYPPDDDFEVHVLGGADAPRQILGELPDNWMEFAFDSVPVRDFLHSLDVMVYFISSGGAEAFGRAPLEAMAVGLPCVMHPRFEPLFGDGALYCEARDTKRVVRELMANPELYNHHARLAQNKARELFSHEALLRRVASLGVDVSSVSV
jgi:hypothetical protein